MTAMPPLPAGVRVEATIDVNDDQTATVRVVLSHREHGQMLDQTFVMPPGALDLLGTLLPDLPAGFEQSMLLVPETVEDLT